ncbi:glycoside hydrolase family 51 protein [Lentinula guzmanii]|uniref:non-reducing end alpha-L-arabinofuranosidase n=1 Tax=Lentinula guzmanii TaxID=2804957 RepID=A0AA38MZ45_9AGAR|nr:glycoside hydrolase family 51 protein [Lentinula guzmanii]
MSAILSSSTLISLVFLCVFVNAQITVVVNETASHAIPSTLWGQMFESGDGGLYAELLQNRAFQMVDVSNQTTALSAWHSVNGAQLTVIEETVPVSSALPNALSVAIPSGSSGQLGIGNEGYFGIKVNSSNTYNASFFYRFPTASSFNGIATVGLQTSTGQVLGASNVTLNGSQTSWLQVFTTIQPTISPASLTNNFTVTVDGETLAGQTINFAIPNGMRIDIAETLSAMAPSFFRLPGGNNLGQTVATRWQWNNTVGPLVERPGRIGDWGYVNTDGLGIFEFLTWCEDLNMQAIMAVWSGFALGGTSIAEDDLGPYIQQAIDQVNFAVGDPTQSDAAALRASLGHPDPFPVAHVEIGNEDFFAADTYTYRWNQFSTALQAAFPNLSFLATSDTFNPVLTPNPAEWDIHVYQTPSWFAENSFIYDGFQRNGTHYFEVGFSRKMCGVSISTNADDIFGTPADGRLTFPTMQSSTGEAAFMIGLERNSDIVFAASYAPLLNHVVDSHSGNVYPSTSYYVQQLFSLNRGDEYLPSTLPDASGTTFWSVVVNTVGTASNVTFQLPFPVEDSATVQLLIGAETDSNTPNAPNTVSPQTSTITVDQTFAYNAPGFSVSALTLTTA